jgi:very-short-patch-repair endonuclease
MRVKLTGVARGLRRRHTNAEVRLWSRLRNRQLCNLKFRRQVPRGKFIADFLCDEAMLILEIDGSQHDVSPNKDEMRSAYLESLGYLVMRFRNYDVLQNTDRVLDHVCAVAEQRRKASSSALRAPSPHHADSVSSTRREKDVAARLHSHNEPLNIRSTP